MLREVNTRFYAGLNDLLPVNWRNTGFNYEIQKPRSVKDLIESIDVPHSEHLTEPRFLLDVHLGRLATITTTLTWPIFQQIRLSLTEDNQ